MNMTDIQSDLLVQNSVEAEIDGEGNVMEDITITESTSPSNNTVPAPRVSQGLGGDIGKPQDIDPTYSDMIFERIEMAREYLHSRVMVEDLYKDVRSICRNEHKFCAFWSVLGECENNPAYMHVNCAPVCETCEMLHVENRCPLDPNAVDTWYPGDLHHTFERIINDPVYEVYKPTVLSRPPEGPWIILFENFLDDSEAERMIELGHEQKYERSADVGTRKADGTYSKSINQGRTSTNSWCLNSCYTDPVARDIMDRIENVTGVPETNSENLQLLRYEVNEFYQTHNDFIPYQVNRQCGVRIMTFYMYLNDVEEGGGTNFPFLNLTVTPKRGRAVLWPSVLDDQPNVQDSRTNHQALPVKKGIKFGANAWIHQRDYKGPNNHACT